MAGTNPKLLTLIEGALHDLESGAPLTPIVEKVQRIARLAGDYRGLWRWSLETRGFGPKEMRARLAAEVRQHLDEDEAQDASHPATEDFIEERTADSVPGPLDEPRMLSHTVAELEMLERGAAAALDQEGWNTDVALSHHGVQVVLSRVRSRLHEYLSRLETSLEVGRASESIFDQYRTYVETRLAQLNTATLEALAAAEKAAREGSSEGRSQAGVSCRRALKQLADCLYPATGQAVECSDGKCREMTADRYVQRLVQFAYENIPSPTDRAMLVTQVERLGEYLDALDDLANKGVHESIDPHEVDQCIIQTFLTVGDFLRWRDHSVGSST
jgi:hypothetical protein